MYIKYHIIIILCKLYYTVIFFFLRIFSRFPHSPRHYSCTPVAKCFYKKSLLLYFIQICFRHVYLFSSGFYLFIYIHCVLSTGTIYTTIYAPVLHSRFSEKNIIYNCMSKIVWRPSVYRYNISIFVRKVSGKV